MKTYKQSGVNLTSRKFLMATGLITTLTSLKQFIPAVIVAGLYIISETVLDFRKGK